MNRESEKKFDAIVTELAAIKDIDMRSFRVLEKLEKMNPEEAAAFLKNLIGSNEKGKADYTDTYMALIRNRDITDSLDYDKVSEIYLAAKNKGFASVVEFLRGGSIRKHKETEQKDTALSKKLAHLTLGEKKAFARRKGYRHIEFLLHDTNPTVIANLLLNPGITESDVIKIASNRMAPKEILEEIFKNNRWVSHYRVKKALVFNDGTPLDISLNLCSFLFRQDLKLIVKDNKLDPMLVKRAGEILAAKE